MVPSGTALVSGTATRAPRPVRLQMLVVGALPAPARDRLRRLVDHADDLSWLSSTSSSGAAGLMISGLRPDIVVLYGAAPAAVDQLAATFPWLTIVVLADAGPGRVRRASRAAHAVLTVNCPSAALLGGIRMAHVARRAANEAGVRDGRGETATERLSERQRDVLVLIAEGNGNAEIARALFISIETVRSHVKELLRRLHARDRAHAVSVAYRTGLLDVHAVRT